MLQSSSIATPLTSWAGLRAHWRNDVLSGFLVFLVALPLCLGIAMASGFPPMSGIITAIIGGVLVSRINGSYMTINGPAAGLIVVIFDAVQALGQGDAVAGFRYTLAAIAVAGLLQVLLGLFKAGRLSAFFPSAVVHGMLAAIGIIIMTKQIHILLGVKPEATTLIGALAEIPHSIVAMNPEVTIIGVSGLVILMVWSLIRWPILKMMPAPLLVVLVGVALAWYFDLDHAPQYRVDVPDNFMAGFHGPDFGKIATAEFWLAVLTIWLIGSLESLLSAAAVDRLDPYKRHSNLNRDLTAVGAGNFISGMIGGLPMIAEIVRSSANINNGAKTGWANFFHGLFLLIFVALFPQLIREIPLSALAALLVFTGFKLASPREFAKILAVGVDHLVVFVVTIIGAVAVDLLVGVFLGIAVELLIHICRGLKLRQAFATAYQLRATDPDTLHIEVSGAAVFSNVIALKSLLADLPGGKTLFFDLTEAELIDHTVMEFIHHFAEEYNGAGGRCQIVGLDGHHRYSRHHLAARRKMSRS
ncbi:MAG: sulfate transporter [Methylomonas sp.]|nr:MAG: sulfate transporter [Methylomonas sp.]PPD26937.1 MAG: sulfate transporter [Methylomonas sp.]PPD38869.1 MAG: sulfate transporter [Methylomonas sp.]PPD41697.1 MAG: sulfate transporter [Methylomonas sp.]PPD54522.1 MAG: sulfate transporter [Methylomonas sp.]